MLIDLAGKVTKLAEGLRVNLTGVGAIRKRDLARRPQRATARAACSTGSISPGRPASSRARTRADPSPPRLTPDGRVARRGGGFPAEGRRPWAPGETKERELLRGSMERGLAGMSADGRRVADLNDTGEDDPRDGESSTCASSDGSPPSKLGDGDAEDLSPDGKWVSHALAKQAGESKIVLVPRRARKRGSSLPAGGFRVGVDGVYLHRRREERSQWPRCELGRAARPSTFRDIPNGKPPQAISSRGVGATPARRLSPDGRPRLRDLRPPTGKSDLTVTPLERRLAATRTPAPNTKPSIRSAGGADGEILSRPSELGSLPARGRPHRRRDGAAGSSGRSSGPPDLSGVIDIAPIMTGRDEKSYAYGYSSTMTVGPLVVGRDEVTLASGSRLGPYEILGLIGAGGMGEVYRARDPRLGRDVAIKVLPASFSQDPDRLRRFEQEAKAAGRPEPSQHHRRLRHREPRRRALRRPGAARGRDAARGARRRALLAAQGDRLRHADRPRPRRRARQGHRPPRPEAREPLRHEGRPRQDPRLRPGEADAGEAGSGPQTNLPTATAGTEPGAVMGTLGYMSPEQVEGKPADARSDIFAFGAILYEMLAGGGVPRRLGRRDDGRDPQGGAAGSLRHEPVHLAGARTHRPPLHREGPRAALSVRARLAFDLEAVSGTSGMAAAAAAAIRRSRRSQNGGARGVAAILIARGSVWSGRRASLGAMAKPASPPDHGASRFARQRPVRPVHC